MQLSNGLTVIHQHLQSTPVVVTDIWVRAGASAEPEGWSGMAHFLEHMIFKGTKRLARGVFDQVIENRGGVTNAATSHDFAHFFLTTATSHLPETLPYLSEILLQAAIPDEEFMRERDVVLEELRYSFDDPDWLGFQALCESLYSRHPYGRSVLGTEDYLWRHTPNQMRCFHATHYQPENMTVVMVGGIEEDKALSLVEKSFSDFSVRSECPPVYIDAEPPITEVRRCDLQLPGLEIARLSMAWLGEGVTRLRDSYGLDLLSVILASGRTSRLVRELREEKQLVQDIGSAFSLQKDSSLFTISAWLEEENLELVESMIRDRLYELQTRPIPQAELDRCKRILCNDYAFSTETPGQLAGLYGYYQTIATAEVATSYPHQIQSLTARDLQQIANCYLSPHHYAITVLRS